MEDGDRVDDAIPVARRIGNRVIDYYDELLRKGMGQ